MTNELKALVAKHGMTAVMATLVSLMNAEAEEVREVNEAAAEKIDELSGTIIRAVAAYDAMEAA
jgi:rRNA maturation endonuclease Nob1